MLEAYWKDGGGENKDGGGGERRDQRGGLETGKDKFADRCGVEVGAGVGEGEKSTVLWYDLKREYK